MLKSVLWGAIFALGTEAFAEERMVVRFKLTPAIHGHLRTQEYDITGVNHNAGHIEALLSLGEMAEVEKLHPVVSFYFPESLSRGPDQEYKNPEEIEAFVKEINGRYPELTEVRSIGKSLEGRDIWAIKVTGENPEGTNRPVFFVNGMHHAREVMTPEITTDLVEYLVKNYKNDADVTRWLDSTEVWVIPMFNVDGNNKMWTADSMWRKNTRNGHGVDINRNYPAFWNTCRGSSGSTWAQDYRGPAAGSEPETQAMMAFVGSIKPVFSISYHSYSEIVIYPFGCGPKRTPSTETVESIGADLGRSIDYRPGTSWELLYDVDGGDIDWLYTAHQVIPYVIEVNSTGEGFHPSYSKWRDKTVLRNRKGWMYLLERLQGPGVHGQVMSGEYSKILIRRTGEKTLYQNYKINPRGDFHVILKRGTYDFIFEGAKSKQLTGIKVDSKITIEL
jgi:carboxypeptidase T